MTYEEAINKYNITRGLQQLQHSKVAFVDCMDTLIKRDISLDELLLRWSKDMEKEFGIYFDFLFNYRREVVESAMHNTVSISTIYDEIFEHCQYFKLIDSIPKELFIEKSHNIELNIELNHHEIIQETVDFLNILKSEGTLIYCVSDFRLPSNDLKIFFEKCHIEGLFVGIISSCDVGKTKKEGSLYPFVLNRINALPEDCIMIGDNLKSDCINAGKAGIRSIWLH